MVINLFTGLFNNLLRYTSLQEMYDIPLHFHLHVSTGDKLTTWNYM